MIVSKDEKSNTNTSIDGVDSKTKDLKYHFNYFENKSIVDWKIWMNNKYTLYYQIQTHCDVLYLVRAEGLGCLNIEMPF